MKKFWVAILAVFFLTLVVSQRQVLAEAGGVATVSSDVDYQLPYPGILPDSPWYFFKVVRDEVTALLVQGKTEKAFYRIFLADKKMAAAEELLVKGKLPLAAVTGMKAEELLRTASLEVFVGEKKNDDLVAKIAVSAAKHREILARILAKYSSRETTKAWNDNEFVRNRILNVLLTDKEHP